MAIKSAGYSSYSQINGHKMVVIKCYKVILPLSVVPIQNHIAGHTSHLSHQIAAYPNWWKSIAATHSESGSSIDGGNIDGFSIILRRSYTGSLKKCLKHPFQDVSAMMFLL